MPSKVDLTVTYLRGLGYTGSIQDMQMRYLETTTGTPAGTGVRSTMQKTVDGVVQDLIKVP